MLIWKLSLNLLWVSSLLIFSISAATERKNLSLSISSQDIISIVVTPNKSHGASRYRLKIYSSEGQKKPTIDISHPLHGQISDVGVYDIDKDEKEELVIKSTRITGTAKVHHDIFELTGISLFDKIKSLFHL